MLAFVLTDVARTLAGADLDAEGTVAPWWQYALAFGAGFAIVGPPPPPGGRRDA